MTFPLIPILTLLFTLSSTATSHYSSSSSSSSFSEWRSARATYYAAADPRDAVGGACGYGDLVKGGYGMATVGLSEVMFERGQICGACFELRCVDDLRWCIPGTSIIVTATNFCAPNYGFPSDGGGHCNPPNKHFVLPIEAFEKIAIWKAANMPVQYRRIKCRKEGGIRFTIDGSNIFISVLIRNVAGAGDIVAVKIKGSRTGWLPMGRNWGQNWHINADLKNQPLSFEVTGSDGVTLASYNVAPKNWNFGQTFEVTLSHLSSLSSHLSIFKILKLHRHMKLHRHGNLISLTPPDLNLPLPLSFSFLFHHRRREIVSSSTAGEGRSRQAPPPQRGSRSQI